MAGDNGIYPYKPNKNITLVAAALFGLSAIYHMIQMIRKRAWFYTSFVIGGLSKDSLDTLW
jgi:hypothetical protein